MRRFFLIIALCCNYGMQARVIKVKDAENVAKSFFSSRQDVKLDLAYTERTEKHADFYVFNKVSENGYVIVSAEDNVDNQILAYSDEGGFDENNIPDNLRWWLLEYKRQIEWVRSNGYEPRRSDGIKKANVVVGPLLGDLSWGQGSPFNEMCPIENNKHCVTGCVATAMAQIIYYNKWPLQGKGVHSYKWKGQTLSVDFSQSEYDYSKMRNKYDTYSDVQAQAVAKLMYDCGVSVEMNYGASSSGAYSDDVQSAFQTYFDYDAGVKYIERDNYFNEFITWDDLIKSELDANRVVYYSGIGPDGGHAFVCDGYNDNGFFHFNFGWNGSSNGYFASAVISTSSGKFNANQAIVIGIKANNKQKSGDFYYNIIGENAVSLASPEFPSEYSGKMVIPSVVSIEGNKFNVTEISSYAFRGTEISSITIPSSINTIGAGVFTDCKNLENIVVPWTDLSDVDISNSIFDNIIFDDAVLSVPAGCIEQYASYTPWLLFSEITDAKGETLKYSEWTPFETGSGTFTYSLIGGTDTGLPIKYRDNMADNNKSQILIEGWGNGSNLLIEHNKAQDKYSVPKQKTNISSNYGYLYVSDIPNYYLDSSYEQYPISLNTKKGLFTLYLIYFVEENSLGTSLDKFQLDGYPDYSVNLTVKTQTEQSNGTAYQLLGFDWGDDIKTVEYSVFDDKYKDEKMLKDKISQMLDGSIETKKVSAKIKDKVTVTLPGEGYYTIIAIGLDENGEYSDYDSKVVSFVKKSSWIPVGEADYTDNIISSVFDCDTVTYKVGIMICPSRPGIYRMVNPYGASYPYNEPGDWDANRDWNIDINATDPDGVIIEEQYSGCDWGYGNMTIMSMGYYYISIDKSYTFEVAKAEGLLGTLKDSIITFPNRGLVLTLSDDYYVANIDGAFRLDLSKISVPDPDAIIDINEHNRRAYRTQYNLNGQMVDRNYQGIIISGGKKIFQR